VSLRSTTIVTAATSTPAEAPAPRDVASGLRVWGTATAGAALAITSIDAFLLQQKKSFFTGGFLSATHANGFADGAGFVATSLIVDASIAGLLAAMILWLTSRLRLRPEARLALVALGALAPLVIWDFVTYSLLGYLGDAFDLGLMFDLTGRSASEVFAVSSSHLATPVALIVAGAVVLLMLVWALDRFGPGASRSRTTASRRLAMLACTAFVGGLLTHGVTSSTSDLAEDGLRRKASGQVFMWLISELTDFDRDGSGIGGRTSDPDPFNAAIYPYGLDVPGNGLDENGVGGDLPSAEPAYSEPAAPAATWRHRPDVVLFVLESFRADAVGRIVNGIQVTPALDALAREGVASARAFSHNGYTTQSRFHVFTGSLAALREGSIVDDFTAQGYQVAYFSGQDESFGGAAMGVGFDRAEVAYDARRDRDRRYSTYTTAGSLAVSHKVLSARIDEFLATRDSARPLFLYVNFHDAHFPYHHRDMEPILSNRRVPQSEIAPGRRSEVQEMYYNAAANVDRALASTLAGVTRALGAPPAVIVTSDHGESLFDEGFLGHGYALNHVQTRIPLIVRGLPMEIAEPFGQVDLRNAIAMALSRDSTNGAPRIVEAPGKTVFQYLGNIHRPRQIAFTGKDGSLVYDFRDRQVLFPDGTRGRPDALSGGAVDQFQRLIHFWERMMLARAAGGGARDE
jgi:hypothetical protein